MQRAGLVVIALAACGAAAVGVETAETAVYQADGAKILRLAERAALDESLQIATIAESYLTFATVGQYYSELGAPQPNGTAYSYRISFVVELLGVGANRYTVSVEPRVRKLLASPQVQELAADDPNVPAWVAELAGHLQLAIYARARGFVVSDH
jgi:hypothetical protein